MINGNVGTPESTSVCFINQHIPFVSTNVSPSTQAVPIIADDVVPVNAPS